MYRFFLVSDATSIATHADIYAQRELFWDPKSESESYAILEPKLKEELNKASSLEFVVLPTNVHYNDFYKRKTVVLAYDENELLFEGYVTAAPVDFFKQKRVVCSSVMAYLCDSVQAPDEKNQVTVPVASKEPWYVMVALSMYHEANPVQNEWYEQEIAVVTDESGNTVYTDETDDQGNPIPETEFTGNYILSTDTVANYDKYYFYKTEGDGRNYSGKLVTKLAAKSETIQGHITRYLDVHNAQMDPYKTILAGNLNTSDNSKHEFGSSSYRATWDGLKSDIIDEYGKYISVKPRNDGNLYLDYLSLDELSGSSVPVIEFARNMIEMSEEDDSDDDFFSILLPVGKDKLTIEKADFSKVVQVNSGEIAPYPAQFGGKKQYVVVSQAATRRYGYVVRTQSFDVSNPTTLYNRAVEYIQNNYDYHNEYNVKAIDLHIIDPSVTKRITVGNKCRLTSEWHEVDERDLYIISAEYDLVNPENDSFKIGIPTQDREAKNRTLTGQHNSTRSSSKSSGASAAAATANLSKKVDDIISVTEWGLKSQTRIYNEFADENGKLKTEFKQDEYYIKLTAQKLFGEQDDDSGFIKVPPDKLVDKNGNPCVPNDKHWYEYNEKTGEYELTRDTYQHEGKDYYIQNLYTRVSDLEVGQGGIHGRVNGNYLNSTYCSSWIEANEKSLLALTGNLYVDENGQVVINTGSGLRTGHTEPSIHEYRYYLVPTEMYSQNPNPKTKGWYEQKLDKTGAWVGKDKADSVTNDNYYISTNDTEVKRSKHYYYKSNTTEEFHADYGVYSEDNLVAGVFAQIINNPDYRPVRDSDVKKLAAREGSPKAQGWYEYDPVFCNYGITLDEHVTSTNKKYYYKIDNYTDYTEIRGEHIVIGKTPDYTGMDAATKAKVDQYITDNDLNGTITEIASDVVVVNTLFAKFIHFDTSEGDYITIDSVYAQNGEFDDHVYVGTSNHDGELYVWGSATIEGEGGLTTEALTMGAVEFDEEKAKNVITGFGTITTTGDTVKIPYMNAEMDDFDNDHVLSFDKPASLGTVTWSSGNVYDTLVVKTAGGKEFFKATLNHPTIYVGNSTVTYDRDGSNLIQSLLIGHKPTLKATMNVSGTWTGESHDSSEDDPVVWTRDLFFDASQAYDDGYSEGWDKAQRKMDFPPAMQGLANVTRLNFKYPSSTVDQQDEADYYLRDDDVKGSTGYIRVYRNYVDENNKGLLVGAINVGGWYTEGHTQGENDVKNNTVLNGPTKFTPGSDTELNDHVANVSASTSYDTYYSYHNTYNNVIFGNRKYFKTPSKGSLRTYAQHSNTEYTSGSINIGYSGSVTIYGQRKMDDESEWSSATNGITITSPSLGTTSTYCEYDTNGDGEAEGHTSGEITLDYGSSVVVKGRHQDGNGDWHYGSNITIKSKAGQALPSVKTYYERYEAVEGGYAWQWHDVSSASTLELEYSESIHVEGSYQDSSGTWHNAPVLTVSSKADRYNNGVNDAKGKIGVSDVAVGSADDDGERAAYNAATTLSYGTTYMYYATYDGSRFTSKKYFKTPANNATTHSISIANGDIDVSTTEPDGTKLTVLKSAITEAIRDKKWLYFKVKCGTTTKQYYMDFR